MFYLYNYFEKPPIMLLTKNFLNIIDNNASGNIASNPAAVVILYLMLSLETNFDATIDIGLV